VHGVTVEELLKAADAAMYRAKHNGGATFEFFSPELTHRAMEKLQLRNALRHPDLLSQLVVHYQPQLHLRSRAIIAVEALVRWNHPEGGLLLPGRFIKAAEEAGLASEIGDWMLRTACNDALAWQSLSRGRSMRVAVNVSAHQIKDERIVKAVRLALEQTGLDPSCLELEVTEDALQIGDEATRVLEQLKRLGVQLALDDFGSGYSSLGSLYTLPFDRLKIDRAFMRNVHNDPNGQSIVRAIIAMAHNLNLRVLAEGVETEEQLSFLRESQCDEAQGYLIGKPVSAEGLWEPTRRAWTNRRLSVVRGR
jgi:EAL domain-containing protein (putative c-di-GMP-specific phosphodiesterase class I)